ncbi:hypothetical protein O5169_27855 [Escherichia coli]|nr:hypothetical protein [Escherichia coli]
MTVLLPLLVRLPVILTPLPSSAVTVHRGVGQVLSPLMSTPAPLPVAPPLMTSSSGCCH